MVTRCTNRTLVCNAPERSNTILAAARAQAAADVKSVIEQGVSEIGGIIPLLRVW